MYLNTFDWTVLAVYGVATVSLGLAFARRAAQGTGQYFLAGRQLPWWILGTSMVATTFSTDTPNLVTDLVRNKGVSGNWMWWAYVITGMCTTFFYARLWRRTGVFTDIGFYELRYSGRPAVFLRAFRAIYLGVFFNVAIMAAVMLAGIKIAGVLVGVEPYVTVLVVAVATSAYAAMSGLRGVVVTDVVLFITAMVGAVAAAWYALDHPAVGGLEALIAHPNVKENLSFLPDFSNWETVLVVFLIPLAVQWWATWYPGAEPGGGGYVAQRLLSARNERHAMVAMLWFNIAHYAIRPWPWILVALASLIVYPTLDSMREAFPHVDPSIVRHDLAYPAMLVFLPHGLLGLVIASLAAALMSTLSTHLNWGASYVIDDVYRRFLVPEQSEAHYIRAARFSTVGLVAIAALVALWLEHALQAFQILLQIGAGTGLIFLLRWFWWRINAWSEITAMIVSFAVAIWFAIVHDALGLQLPSAVVQLLIGVAITTSAWLIVTFVTQPTETAVLQTFYSRVRPFSRGWRHVVNTKRDESGSVTSALIAWLVACVLVYLVLFGTGFALYGDTVPVIVCVLLAIAAAVSLFKVLRSTT
ncbi:MAG: Na+:solute symporter [Gammaproteobacteria bacterium]|nr:Na+:solute symporter [Gammaproteobacteria bacterium]